MVFSPIPLGEKALKAAFEAGEKVVIVADKSQEGSDIVTTYVATAAAGSASSDAVWKITRIIAKDDGTFDGKTIDGAQIEYRAPMALDNYDDPTVDGLDAWEAVPWA